MIKLLIQAFWTSLITSSSSFLSFLGIAVLARYISPETFGVYIFCLAAKEIISSTCAPSLSQAYLFSDGTPEDLGNVCKINILYSFFIAIVSIIAAFIIKVKYGDFKQITRSKTLTENYTPKQIKKIGVELLQLIPEPEKGIRLIGLQVSNFDTDDKDVFLGQLELDFKDNQTILNIHKES